MSKTNGKKDYLSSLNKVASHESEIDIISNRHGKESWQVRYFKFINSPTVQHGLQALLLCDVVVLFIEMFVDVEYPHCRLIERDATSCGSYVDLNEGDVVGERYLMGRFLAGDEGGHHICQSPYVETGIQAGCDERQHSRVEALDPILFYITITILSTFLIEVMTMLFSLGPKLFFYHPLNVLDFFVITSSLVLVLAFHFVGKHNIGEVAGLFILGRIWRMIRVGHGLISTTYEIANERSEDLEENIKMLEEELKKNGLPLPEGCKEP